MTYRPKPQDEISRNMSAIRSTGNKAEVALRKYLHALGYRYRVQPKDVFGKPDFVFPSPKIAVFVDGDFWHARVLRENGERALRRRLKTRNRSYWIDKFRRRVVRDDEVTSVLETEGWTVIRCWETEVTADLPAVALTIAGIIESEKDEARAE